MRIRRGEGGSYRTIAAGKERPVSNLMACEKDLVVLHDRVQGITAEGAKRFCSFGCQEC
jgi:hypothetical protein